MSERGPSRINEHINAFVVILVFSIAITSWLHKNFGLKDDGFLDDLKIEKVDDENKLQEKIRERLKELQLKHNKYLKTTDKEEKKKIMPSHEIDEMRNLYVLEYLPLAIEISREYKIPTFIILAQGILESGAGSSDLFYTLQTKNHFCLKCREHSGTEFSNEKDWSGCCVQYRDDSPGDRFLVFKTDKEAFVAYAQRLSTDPRYKNCFKCRQDYKCWARELKKAGYATDKKYPEKIINIIEKYYLSSFDVN